MSGNAIFNAAVCAIGIAIILIHSVNLLLKKGRRKDENRLLVFLLFTIIHFATYLTFTLVKTNYTSDAYVITFYTIFYIFNNVEMLLLFLYMLSYVKLSEKVEKTLSFFNYFVFSIFIILDIVNIFTHMFFTSIDGEYTRANLMILSQGYQFIMFVVVFLVTIINKELVVRQKIAFAFYCLLPLIAIILQNFFKGYAIAYLALLIAVEILFLFLNVEKNIMIEEDEKKLKDANVKIMMSQIQPHFIYNTLSSIVIDVNFQTTKKGLEIVVSSNGEDYDPFVNHKQKYLEKFDNDIEEGGFGTSLIKELSKSHSYEYKDGRSIIKVVL